MLLTLVMPQSPYPSSHTTARTTMSLAILPSAPMAYSNSSKPVLMGSNLPSPSKRPKLSLNTAGAPSVTFGKGSTSLRLDTLSAVSPTSRNTFSNAYNPIQPLRKSLSTHSPRSPRSPRSLRVRSSKPRTSEDGFLKPASSLESRTFPSTLPPVDQNMLEVPYKLALGVISILANSPLPRLSHHDKVSANAEARPARTKRVSFRAPLTEEIQTTKFTLRHSDIESSTSSISTLDLSRSERRPSRDEVDARVAQDEQDEGVFGVDSKTESISPQTGEKRESSDEEDSDTCPVTPVVGRRKRQREWVWTLGPENQSEYETHFASEDVGAKETLFCDLTHR
ncbi:uncharacterized protein K489DRAFT_376985 [Dissoconium aciculare CBS 342.82]|uniref:Uncharacterized protein n=1 Tax=Dissoconium aciculare CBS 342.82 TaxID=1314786 RepID=A0A6J3MFX3_9PEZI|nr:uncharacterized protein K489DRAFT_376985 [Dissoconium aciculare CBS 342.82]KAF1826559.1 hypothetical protein K489DRAFT_376985 [Dissoconium aciculare CBS 342.82]